MGQPFQNYQAYNQTFLKTAFNVPHGYMPSPAAAMAQPTAFITPSNVTEFVPAAKAQQQQQQPVAAPLIAPPENNLAGTSTTPANTSNPSTWFPQSFDKGFTTANFVVPNQVILTPTAQAVTPSPNGAATAFNTESSAFVPMKKKAQPAPTAPPAPEPVAAPPAPAEDPLLKKLKDAEVPEEDQPTLTTIVEKLRAPATTNEERGKIFKDFKSLLICKKVAPAEAFWPDQKDRAFETMSTIQNFKRSGPQRDGDSGPGGYGRGRGNRDSYSKYSKPPYPQHQHRQHDDQNAPGGDGSEMKIGGMKPQQQQQQPFTRDPPTEEEKFVRREADKFK